MWCEGVTVVSALVTIFHHGHPFPRLRISAKLLKLLEAATGFEPVNNGFAVRCLSHLATPPYIQLFRDYGLL